MAVRRRPQMRVCTLSTNSPSRASMRCPNNKMTSTNDMTPKSAAASKPRSSQSSARKPKRRTVVIVPGPASIGTETGTTMSLKRAFARSSASCPSFWVSVLTSTARPRSMSRPISKRMIPPPTRKDGMSKPRKLRIDLPNRRKANSKHVAVPVTSKASRIRTGASHPADASTQIGTLPSGLRMAIMASRKFLTKSSSTHRW